jgi:ribonuclease P protein component
VRRAGRYLVVYAWREPPQAPTTRARLGITASRKVGNAVVRNRVKRWVRESYRRLTARPKGSADVVVIAKPTAAMTTFHGIESELRSLLTSIEDT